MSILTVFFTLYARLRRKRPNLTRKNTASISLDNEKIIYGISVHSSASRGVFFTARKNVPLCQPETTQSGLGLP